MTLASAEISPGVLHGGEGRQFRVFDREHAPPWRHRAVTQRQGENAALEISGATCAMIAAPLAGVEMPSALTVIITMSKVSAVLPYMRRSGERFIQPFRRATRNRICARQLAHAHSRPPARPPAPACRDRPIPQHRARAGADIEGTCRAFFRNSRDDVLVQSLEGESRIARRGHRLRPHRSVPGTELHFIGPGLRGL